MTCALGSIGCGSVQNAAVDASPDSTGSPDSAGSGVSYDIGYVNDLTVAPNITKVAGLLLVVNRGAAPLKISSASVVIFDDDNTSIDWTFSKESDSMIMLKPGRAAGLLSPAAMAQVVTGGLVTEPIDDQLLNFAMSFPSPPAADTTLRAEAVIRIEAVDLTVPFTIHIVASGGVELNSAKRIAALP